MANNYYSQHPEKSHFSDAGLMIALAVCIVTIIKLLMYGFTYVSLAWLALTIVYVAISSATQAKSKVRTAATAAFMVISAVAFVAAFTFDYPIQPKTESNLRAEQDENKQNQQNVEEIPVETPKPVVVETDVVSEDESKFEDVAPNSTPEEYPEVMADQDEEDIEVIDLHADEAAQVEPNSNVQPNAVEHNQEEEAITGFDESFQ